MEFRELEIKGVILIVLKPNFDDRGFFMRTYDSEIFKQHSLKNSWLQENHSRNLKKNTLRGLHFCLNPYTESKLIRCIRGKVYDVHVDLRKDSATFGKWGSVILSEEDQKWLYLPKGMAHGFCTLEDNSELLYKHDIVYNNQYDSGILWNDPDLRIEWPGTDPVISEKDSKLMSLKDFIKVNGGLDGA